MGIELAQSHLPQESNISVPWWLDTDTAGLVRTITHIVARRHPDLRAVILFGSVARHDERPLDDSVPSDVDLLLLFDLEPGFHRLPYERRFAINMSIGLALDHYPHAPREVNTVLATRDLSDWDVTFMESVARDGILLWARGPLPAPLASIAGRTSSPPAEETNAPMR